MGGRKTTEQTVFDDLLNVLPRLSQAESAPLFLNSGGTLKTPHALLLDSKGSLGVVSRLILIRFKLKRPAKDLAKEFGEKTPPGSRASTLKQAFSLTTAIDGSKLPTVENLNKGMGAILNQWRKTQGGTRKGLGPHPELELLFRKAFVGDDAKRQCDEFLTYLELMQSTAEALSSKRTLYLTPERENQLNLRAKECVEGTSMLINVHAEGQPDGLRAYAETLAVRIAKMERGRVKQGNVSPAEEHRDVLFVPLRANAPLSEATVQEEPESLVMDEHMGLDRLMGILSEFCKSGSSADVTQVSPMRDEVGFTQALQALRESLMRTPRIFVFDGAYYEPNRPDSLQIMEHVLADDNFDYVLSRLMDPLIASTDEPHNLDIFARNRFVVTSNRESWLVNKLGAVSDDNSMTPHLFFPSVSSLQGPGADGYSSILADSLRYGDAVAKLLKLPVLNMARNDVAHQCLDAAIGMVRVVLAHGSTDVNDDVFTWRAVDLLSSVIAGEGEKKDPLDIVHGALFGALLQLSDHAAISENTDSAPNSHQAKLWCECLLLIALTAEGLTLDTLKLCLARASFSFQLADLPCPALSRAMDSGELEVQILRLVECARPILGFIRREFVDGPEIADHPLEFWEGLSGPSTEDTETPGMTLDFRYPEIRRTVFRTDMWARCGMDRPLLARLFSEVSLQYQTSYFRHTDYLHRGSVRNWRRLLICLYHGLVSISSPSLEQDRDFGIRGVDSKGTTLDYWMFLYGKLFRQVMDGPGIWRVSRVMGVDDLKTAILELFSKPWLLDPATSLLSDTAGLPRFVEYFSDNPELRAEYYLTRMRGALARGKIDQTTIQWHDRFKRDLSEAEQKYPRLEKRFNDYKLRFEYTEMDRCLQNVEMRDIDSVLDILEKTTGCGAEFSSFQNLCHDRQSGAGLVARLPNPATSVDSEISDMFCLVDHEQVSRIVGSIVERSSPGTAALALSYFGTLSRFESDLVDFSEGYRELGAFPKDTNEELVKRLEKHLIEHTPRQTQLRQQALARLILVEVARIALFRIDPTGTGLVRSNSQGRTAVRLAIKLDNDYRDQAPSMRNELSIYFRLARRVADSATRMAWPFPRDQANVQILEAAMLRSESERLLSSSVGAPSEPDLLKAERLLNAARSTLGTAERVLTTPNAVSRVRLRLLLERYKLNQDQAELCKLTRHADSAGELPADDDNRQRVFQQHAAHDFAELRKVASGDRTRPYWKLIVAFQKGMARSIAKS